MPWGVILSLLGVALIYIGIRIAVRGICETPPSPDFGNDDPLILKLLGDAANAAALSPYGLSRCASQAKRLIPIAERTPHDLGSWRSRAVHRH